MNRKFFTWVAGTLLLAASLQTANAQSEVTIGDPAKAIPEKDPGLYQLKVTPAPLTDGVTGDFLLTLDSVGTVGVLKGGAKFVRDSVTYGHTLWCLNIPEVAVGASRTIDFTNKGYGSVLSVSSEDVGDTLSVDFGVYNGWRHSLNYQKPEEGKPLYTYFDGDSILTLALLTKGDESYVSVVKLRDFEIDEAIKGKEADGTTAKKWVGIGNSITVQVLLFTITEPTPIELTAAAFNTVLYTVGADPRALKFEPDATIKDSNPWSANELYAVPSKATDGTDNGWINFVAKFDDKGKPATYVRVDTALRGNTTWLKFAIDSLSRTGKNNELTARSTAIRNQYDFKAFYNVSSDSIAIYVREARLAKTDGQTWEGSTPTTFVTGNVDTTKLLVSLFDSGSERFLTLGEQLSGTVNRKAATKIELGLGCDISSVSPGLTSIDEDVYVIKKGNLILVADVDKGAQWVTYSAATVDPNYIPAYQWVVKKERTGTYDKPLSPVKIISRETGLTVQTQLQFKGDSAELGGQKVKGEVDFYPVPEAQKSDPFLGSFHPEPVDIKYNTYTLRYHSALPLTTDYYLSTEASDTALVIATSLTEYKFFAAPKVDGKVPVDTVKYGYPPTPADIKDLKLAQLQYIPYTLRKNVEDKGIAPNYESRYVLQPDYVAPATFRLKTANVKEEEGEYTHYYTLVQVTKKENSLGSSNAKYDETSKLQIAEDNLWAYAGPTGEQKSAAFAVEAYAAPLYRKFDGNKDYLYGKGANNTVEEPFGTEENAPLWLKFKQEESNQYLFESAEPTNEYHKGIQAAILGSRNIKEYVEKDNFKYTFYVDTAFVNRKSDPAFDTNTLMPQYLLAVRPDIAPATEDSPALTKASYLFNTTDSTYTKSPEYGYDKSTTPTYFGFVDAVHYVDTVYVLPSALKEKTAAELQEDPSALYAIPTVRKIYLNKNVQYSPAQKAAENNRKSVVFQFRLATGSTEEGNPTRAFYIETEGTGIAGGTKWIKVDNGVPVLHGTMPDATLFNVAAGDEGQALSNEKIAATSKVRVVSGAGSVNILNATGKKVTVTNILGQNLATQVINSNNARISLPQGIVVVTVEGEPAVKAIVSR